MIYPFLHLVTTQPQLVADHVEAYAELVSDDIGEASIAVKRQVMLNAVALCSLGVGAVLSGVALMLWAVTPVATIQAPWALIVGPLLPLAVAIGCRLASQTKRSGKTFDNVRAQLMADMAMFRETSKP
jgi:hypothetical protein